MCMTKRRKISPKIEPYVLSNVKKTVLYDVMYETHTIKSSILLSKYFQIKGISKFKKADIVATVVTNMFVNRIQKQFHRSQRKLPCDYNEEDHCLISMEPLYEIPQRNRYTHSNCFFDKEQLALNMYKSSDFLHPITRVEFTIQEVITIDPNLENMFKNRIELQEIQSQNTNLVQNFENEMETLFNSMLAVVSEVSSNRELRITLDYLQDKFSQELENLIILDNDRARIMIKSFVLHTEKIQETSFSITQDRSDLILRILYKYALRTNK